MPFKGTKRPFASLVADAIADVHNLVDEAIDSHSRWLDCRKAEVLRLTNAAPSYTGGSSSSSSRSSSSSSSSSSSNNAGFDSRMNALLDEATSAAAGARAATSSHVQQLQI